MDKNYKSYIITLNEDYRRNYGENGDFIVPNDVHTDRSKTRVLTNEDTSPDTKFRNV